MRGSTNVWQGASTRDNPDWVADQDRAITTKDDAVSSSGSDTSTDVSELGDVVSSPEKRVDCEDEFGEDELEKRALCTPHADVTLELPQSDPRNTPSIRTLRQVVQIKDGDSDRGTTERLGSSSNEVTGEHFVDTQGFPPCKASPGRLSYWEEAETGTHLEEERLLLARSGATMEWFGIRRKDRESVQHHTCCFGINHAKHFNDHHLYMVDVVSEDDQPQEFIPREAEDRKGSGTAQSSAASLVLQRKRPYYYDRQQQLELVLEAQRLLEAEEHDSQSASFDEKEECEADSRSSDIWEDNNCMELLQTGVLPATVDPLESKRARNRTLNYHWQGQSLYFKGLLVPRPEDRMGLVIQMHKDLGHFGEERTLAEVCRRVALDTAGPLLETRSGNRQLERREWCGDKWGFGVKVGGILLLGVSSSLAGITELSSAA
ncbi:unnamed protein product [Sphagnum compactum]